MMHNYVKDVHARAHAHIHTDQTTRQAQTSRWRYGYFDSNIPPPPPPQPCYTTNGRQELPPGTGTWAGRQRDRQTCRQAGTAEMTDPKTDVILE